MRTIYEPGDDIPFDVVKGFIEDLREWAFTIESETDPELWWNKMYGGDAAQIQAYIDGLNDAAQRLAVDIGLPDE